jgi:hypothetical protein
MEPTRDYQLSAVIRRESACEDLAMRFRIPSVCKKLPAGLAKFPSRFPAPFPAGATQGICFKPLPQLHKAGCESPDRGAILKKSLPISLPAGNPPSTIGTQPS